MTLPTPIEERLGRAFVDRSKLAEALTHSTYANEHPEEGPDNERLEFLGDAVLDLVVSEMLYQQPGGHLAEGEMSRRRARVVRRSALARLADHLELGDHILFGAGQQKSGQTESILANAYEALVGAVYLDGGLTAVQTCFGEALGEAVDAAQTPLDFKTRLQEVCHQRSLSAPTYRVVNIDGPDHARWFECQVDIGGEVMGGGEGSSKKAAEQECAEQAVGRLEHSVAGTG